MRANARGRAVKNMSAVKNECAAGLEKARAAYSAENLGRPATENTRYTLSAMEASKARR